MYIDRYNVHKHLKPESLDAAMLTQAISWIEESHYWQPTSSDGTKRVRCRWCFANRDDYFAGLSDMQLSKLTLCESNPILKAYCGDPTIPFTLNRIKA